VTVKCYSAIVYALGIAFNVALVLFPKHAPAQDVVTARGLMCDTAEQVARVLKADDFFATIASVNSEKAQSCEVTEVAFIINSEGGPKIFIGTDAWQVTQVTVVAAKTPRGMVLVEPTIQWTAFQVDHEG
jgi:hypothetical protein